MWRCVYSAFFIGPFCSFLLCLTLICGVEYRLVISEVRLGEIWDWGFHCLYWGMGIYIEGKLMGSEGPIFDHHLSNRRYFCKHTFVCLWGTRLKTIASGQKFLAALCFQSGWLWSVPCEWEGLNSPHQVLFSRPIRKPLWKGMQEFLKISLSSPSVPSRLQEELISGKRPLLQPESGTVRSGRNESPFIFRAFLCAGSPPPHP